MIKSTKSFDGINISYKVEKNNPPSIILLHGVGMSNAIWAKEIEFLSKAGFRVIAPDLRGHGLSETPKEKGAFFLENFAKDLNHILKKEKTKDVVLVGHSLGGVISILYYKLFKDNVKSMVLINTDYRIPIKFYLGIKLCSILDKLNLLRTTEEKKKVLRSISHCIGQIRDYSRKFRKQNEELLSNINIPVLFIEGTSDELIPPKHMDLMCSFIKNVKVEKIKGAHHKDILSGKLGEVNHYIAGFLSENLNIKINFEPVPQVAGLLFLGVLIGTLSHPQFLSSFFGGGVTGAVVGTSQPAQINIVSLLWRIAVSTGLLSVFYIFFRKKK